MKNHASRNGASPASQRVEEAPAPCPEIEKICSTMITPPIKNAVSRAATVVNGIERVAERVPGDDLARRNALGARGPDVVGVQHVEHRRRGRNRLHAATLVNVSTSTGSARWRK